MGIYINSGSIYENESNSGSSALLECLAWKSTKNRDTLQIMTEVEEIGANIVANASREQMTYTIDCLKTFTPQALEILCDSVLNPKFVPEEIEDQKLRLQSILDNKEVHVTLMNEYITRAAYEGAYGKPLIPDLAQLPKIDDSLLQSFVAERYTAPNIILTAAGVEHETLVKLAKPMLSHLASGHVAAEEPPSKYKGGTVYMPGSNPQANLLLAFEYPGGWRDIEGAVVMTVLNYLLGGGSSFSSGGPGKGMHSRLYTRVLNQYSWCHSCQAFNSTFNQSGLVGIQGSSDPAYANNLLAVMCHQMELLAVPPNQIELERAKRATISNICNALESKATSAEDIGRQFLSYGKRISGREYVEMIEAVTAQDVARFVTKLLGSTPSLAAFGDNTESMSHDLLFSRYGS